MPQTSVPPGAGHRQNKAVGRRYRGAGRLPSQAKRAPKPRISIWTRLRYRVDNALSRGAWVVIGYLGLLTLAFVFVGALIAVIARLAGWNGGGGRLGIFEAMWQMFVRIVDSGSFAGDQGPWTRLVAVLITLTGIFIAGSLIGLIAAAVDQRIDALRRGRSHVVESGHTLILGWSPRVPTIVGELVIANESERRAAIVILAEKDKTEMEEEIRSSVHDLRTTRVVCRRGDPGGAADLRLAAVESARSIVVTSDDGDASSIRAALAVLGLGLDAPVVVEMASAERATTLEAVTGGTILTVNSDRVIAEVTAQACREAGLSTVFQELLDFDGDELYLRAFPELDGSTYAQAQQSFEKAAVIGVAGEEGIELNPSPDRVIAADERIIALVEDDSVFTWEGLRSVPQVEVRYEPDPEPAQHILVVGWSHLAPVVIRELDDFLTDGSRITLVIDGRFVPSGVAEASSLAAEANLVHTTIDVRTSDGGPEAIGDLLGDEAYAQAILLGYRRGMSAANADAETLLTLMGLRRRWPRGHPPEVRLVAEVLDQRNVDIAQKVGVDDFIVSDRLASLMIAQLSERAELRDVFDELFDATGASIVLRPAARFVQNGSPMTFAQLVAGGNRFGESVLGYRRASDGRVLLNLPKSQQVDLGPRDEVVVVTTREPAAR